MQYDLILKNGTLIDGSGLPRFQADVGISHGKSRPSAESAKVLGR